MEKDTLKTAGSICETVACAVACCDSDLDFETAVNDFESVKEGLRTLLPKAGAYVWIFRGIDRIDVVTASSAAEAEKSLNNDINETLRDLDEMDDTLSMSHRSTLKNDGKYVITARDGYDTVSWERMYDPDLTDTDTDPGPARKEFPDDLSEILAVLDEDEMSCTEKAIWDIARIRGWNDCLDAIGKR